MSFSCMVSMLKERSKLLLSVSLSYKLQNVLILITCSLLKRLGIDEELVALLGNYSPVSNTHTSIARKSES